MYIGIKIHLSYYVLLECLKNVAFLIVYLYESILHNTLVEEAVRNRVNV